MECSVLFVLGSLHQVKTAALLCLDGSPLRWDQGEYAPDGASLHAALDIAIQAALQALVKISI